MNNTEKLRYNLGFEEVISLIENKRIDFNKDPTSIIYVDKIKKFFNDVVKGLESRLEPEHKGKDCFFMEDLREIVEASGFKYQNASEEDIRNTIKEFGNQIWYLSMLKENPEEFYKSKEAESLLDYCKKIKNSSAFNYSYS